MKNLLLIVALAFGMMACKKEEQYKKFIPKVGETWALNGDTINVTGDILYVDYLNSGYWVRLDNYTVVMKANYIELLEGDSNTFLDDYHNVEYSKGKIKFGDYILTKK